MVTAKVGIIIQARLASSRLPGKVLLPLPSPHGPPIIVHIIQRALAACNSSDNVVLATSQNPDNEQIVRSVSSYQIQAYRGDEFDVLSRFTDIIQHQHFDHVVRLTADNPFIDPDIIRQTISEHLQKGVDYTSTNGFPLGMNVEVIRSSALLRSASETKNPSHREYVTSHIIMSPDYSKHSYQTPYSQNPQLRLTVDYPSDYALACEIADRLYPQNSLFGLKEIFALVQKRPWLPLINADNWQIKDYPTWEKERKDACEVLKKLGMVRAAAIVANSSL